MIPFDVRLANFLDTVSFIADTKRQRAVWVERGQGVSSVISLGELYAQFFDDNDIDNFIADDLDRSALTVEQRISIRRFRDALNKFSKAPGVSFQAVREEELVDDLEWSELVALAKSTLGMFRNDDNVQT